MKPQLTRKALAACLNRLKTAKDVIQDKEFMYYHVNRNFFNAKYSSGEGEVLKITSLTQSMNGERFTDNFGRKWTEASRFGILYHQSKTEVARNILLPNSQWATRKFFSKDEYMAAVGYDGCEFELVIRNGSRLISGPHMETYNFGPYGLGSTLWGLHDKYDVAPHKASPNYNTTYYLANKIEVIDKPEKKWF